MKLLSTGTAVETADDAAPPQPRYLAGTADPATPASAGQQPPGLSRPSPDEQSLELLPLDDEQPQTASLGATSVGKGNTGRPPGDDLASEAAADQSPSNWPVPQPMEPPLQDPAPAATPLPPLSDDKEDLERMGQVANSPPHRGGHLPPIDWKKKSLLERLGFGKK